MKRKHVVAIVLFFLCLLPFGFAGSRHEKTADLLILGLCGVGALSMLAYKAVLWFRYRSDPVKREALICSTQLLPPRLRRFIFDEEDRPPERGV